MHSRLYVYTRLNDKSAIVERAKQLGIKNIAKKNMEVLRQEIEMLVPGPANPTKQEKAKINWCTDLEKSKASMQESSP